MSVAAGEGQKLDVPLLNNCFRSMRVNSLHMPEVDIVSKMIDLSFSFNEIDRDTIVVLVRETQQSNSGLDLILTCVKFLTSHLSFSVS